MKKCFCFPRSRRLLRRQDFLNVYKYGKKFHAPRFVVFLLESKGGASRLGVTVSRRVGKAVVRNRVKRQLREVFRLNSELFGDMYCDVVFNVKRAATRASMEELEVDFRQTLKRWREEMKRW